MYACMGVYVGACKCYACMYMGVYVGACKCMRVWVCM